MSSSSGLSNPLTPTDGVRISSSLHVSHIQQQYYSADQTVLKQRGNPPPYPGQHQRFPTIPTRNRRSLIERIRRARDLLTTSASSSNSQSTPSLPASGPALPALPNEIFSTFSYAADAVLLWTNEKGKEGSLIRWLAPPASGPQVPHAAIQLDQGYSVCGAAEAQGRNAILATRATDKTVVLMVGDAAQSLRDTNSRTEIILTHEGADLSRPLCMSISADGRQVAVGFGEKSVLVNLDVGPDEESRCAWLTVRSPEEMESMKVEFQACNFSPSGGTVVFSTHVKKKGTHVNRPEDSVYTAIWPIDAATAKPGRRHALASCQIPCVRFSRRRM